MEWDVRKIIKGKAIKDMWVMSEGAVFWTEDIEGNRHTISLATDIEDDSWYQFNYDMGKIEIYPIDFVDNTEDLKKSFFGL